MATFSERLKLLRKRAGLTQTQLAEKMGFKPGAVGNWESGANPPSRESLRKLASILGTTELFISGESDIDSLVVTHPDSDHAPSLEFSRMTTPELEFIFESRQKELSDQKTGPERKRELLGIISEVAGEMKKRIPVSSKEIAALGAEKILKAAMEEVSGHKQPSPADQPGDGGHQGSKIPPPSPSSKKHS